MAFGALLIGTIGAWLIFTIGTCLLSMCWTSTSAWPFDAMAGAAPELPAIVFPAFIDPFVALSCAFFALLIFPHTNTLSVQTSLNNSLNHPRI